MLKMSILTCARSRIQASTHRAVLSGVTRLPSLCSSSFSAGQRTPVLPLALPLRTASFIPLVTLKSQQTKMPQNDHWIFLTAKANFQEKKRKSKKLLFSFQESAIASVSYSNTHECQQNQQSCSFGDLKT